MKNINKKIIITGLFLSSIAFNTHASWSDSIFNLMNGSSSSENVVEDSNLNNRNNEQNSIVGGNNITNTANDPVNSINSPVANSGSNTSGNSATGSNNINSTNGSSTIGVAPPASMQTNGTTTSSELNECIEAQKNIIEKLRQEETARVQKEAELLKNSTATKMLENDCVSFKGYSWQGITGIFDLDSLLNALKGKVCQIAQRTIDTARNQAAVSVPLPLGMGNVGLTPSNQTCSGADCLSQTNNRNIDFNQIIANQAGNVAGRVAGNITNNAISNSGIRDIKANVNNTTYGINNGINGAINNGVNNLGNIGN